MNYSISYATLIDVPRILRGFVSSNPVFAFSSQLKEKYKLTDEQVSEMGMIKVELILRTLAPNEIESAVESRLKLPSSQTKEIAVTLLEEFCGPIRWYFPGIESKLATKSLFPIEQPTATVDAAVAELMKLCDDVPAKIKEKLQPYLIEQLRAQAYDEAAMQKQLGSSVSEGGWGLSDQRLRDLMIKYREYVGVYKFSDAPDVGMPIIIPPKKIDPATISSTVLETHESAEVVTGQPAATVVSDSHMTAQQEAIIDAVLSAIDLQGLSDDMRTRWTSIVEARVRGVRDEEKTKTILLSSADQGGMNFSKDEAQRISKLLEQTVAGSETKRNELSVLEKIASVQKQTAGLAIGPEEKQKQTQKELNERFLTMFGKSAVEEMRKETHREIQTAEAAHPQEVGHTAMQVEAPAPAIIMPPPAPIPEQPPKYIPKVPDKLKALIDAENPIFPTKNKSSLFTPKQKKSGDIKPVKHLIGPVDELSTMTLVDFRRLSPDPTVRIQKIRSKIEVIGQNGALEKIAAMHAVEQSEPVRLYRDILKQSLIQGKSSQEICDARKTAHEPFLEPSEIVVIKEFLQQIRYSNI